MLFGYRHQLFTSLENPEMEAWEFTKQQAQRAETDGFASFWLMDHFYNFHGQDHSAPFLDVWTALPAVAMVTKTIRLGPLVTPVGCVGVMAAEVRHEGERDAAKLAAAAIVAAQLATLVGPPSTRAQARTEAV